MCGIAGIFSRRGQPQAQETLERMMVPLLPRGPDAQGQFREGGIGLVHTRLSIMDPEPRSNQPMLSDRWALIYNGEIYNFARLREDLKGQGARFHTSGDTEVLLRAIEIWGVGQTLDKLIGMFAFAAYDRLEQTLHLARDPFGMKPLYLTQVGQDVAFASWPSSLMTLDGWPRTFDAEGLWEYYLLGHPFSGRTLVKEIEEVAPGTHVIVSDKGLSQRQFWTVQATHQPYHEDEIFGLLEEVTADHARSDVPSALFLSGGVDSSTLAMTYPELQPFHLHSAEERYARQVAEHVGQALEVHEMGDLSQTDALIEELTRTTGVAYFSPIQPLIISKAMSEAGYKVAFSANGGDELYLGYPRTAAPGAQPDLSGLPFERPCAQSFEAQLRHVLRSPETVLVAGRSVAQTAARAEDFFADETARLAQADVPEDAAYRWYEIDMSVRRNLNPTTDACSMLYGLEVRTPFVDQRLIEHSLSLPTEALINEQVGRKAPLKAYLRAKGVPEQVYLRPKMGFSLGTEYSLAQRDARLAALQRLSELDLIRYRPSIGLLGRDFAYVAAASQACLAWYEAFVETGIVSR